MPSIGGSSLEKITNVKRSYPLSKLRNFEKQDPKRKNQKIETRYPDQFSRNFSSSVINKYDKINKIKPFSIDTLRER
jgi:hypothetical protein